MLGDEKLNHERLNRIRTKELASEIPGRRCRIAKVRTGAVLSASAFVRGNSAGNGSDSLLCRESVTGRKAEHTCADRTVIRPSNVNPESKIDANAGTTVASGGWLSGGLVSHQILNAKRRSGGERLSLASDQRERSFSSER